MKIGSLIKSTRPKTLMVGVTPVILGSTYAHHQQDILFSFGTFALTLICTILLQTGTNVVNEYYDFKTGVDSTNRIGPQRSLLSGELKPETLKIFFISCFILSFLLGIYLMFHGGPIIISMGLFAILTAYCYTGGPLPLSHFYLGEFLAFLFFGPIAVIGSYFLQSLNINSEIILLSFIPGFISAALMSLNNTRDIETDKKTDKKTIAIFIGEKNARIMTVGFGLAPIFITLILIKQWGILALTLIIPPVVFSRLWKTILLDKNISSLNNGIAAIGKYNVLYCTLTSILFYLS